MYVRKWGDDIFMMQSDKYGLYKYFQGVKARLYVFIRSILLFVETIERWVPTKGLIYDIGCGYGLCSAYFSLKQPSRRIVGVDIDQKRIDTASSAFKELKNISFECRDLVRDKGIGDCDCIVLYDLLHHVDANTKRKILKACKNKVENRKGIVIIKEIDGAKKGRLLFTYIFDRIMSGNSTLDYTTSKHMMSLLESLGFKIEHVEALRSFWFPHYALVCKI